MAAILERAAALDFDDVWGDGGTRVNIRDDVWVGVDDAVGAGALALASQLCAGGVLGPGAVAGKRVVELGASSGLAGLAAAAGGARSAALLAVEGRGGGCRRSADRAARDLGLPRTALAVVDFDWGAFTARDGGVDVVLVCDVGADAGLSLATLRRWCRGDGAGKPALYVALDEADAHSCRYAACLSACRFEVREIFREGGVAVYECFATAAATDVVAAPLPPHDTTLRHVEDGVDLEIVQRADLGNEYGVWPGAVALADHVSATFGSKNFRAFELGCGSGYLGLLLAARGARHVTLSDAHLNLAAWNLALNYDAAADAGCSVDARRVRWDHEDDVDGFDLGVVGPRETFLVVGAELLHILDSQADLAREVYRRLLSAATFGRDGVALLTTAPCARPRVTPLKKPCDIGHCACCLFLRRALSSGLALDRVCAVAAPRRKDPRLKNADVRWENEHDEAIWVLHLRLRPDD